MKIKKIVLKDKGLKGCDVTYSVEEKKDGRLTTADYIAKKKHTIHLALDRPFKDLRIHLLELCEVVNEDMEKDTIDHLIKETEVIGIEFGGGECKIWGQKETLRNGNNEKYLTLKPPAVDESDEYPHIESIAALVKTIVEETKMYLKGDAKVTDEEVVVRWIEAGKKKDFDKEAFDALPEEERKKIAAGILEEMGAVVMMPDEVEKVDESKLEEIPKEFDPIKSDDPPAECWTGNEPTIHNVKADPEAGTIPVGKENNLLPTQEELSEGLNKVLDLEMRTEIILPAAGEEIILPAKK